MRKLDIYENENEENPTLLGWFYIGSTAVLTVAGFYALTVILFTF